MDKQLQPKLRFSEFNGEWSNVKLGEITSKIGSGKTPLGGDKVYTTNGIPFIRSQNVNQDRLLLDEIHIPKEVHVSMNSSKVIPYDILLNITGASIGRSCVVPNSFQEGNVNQHVCIIRLKNDIPSFVQRIISSFIGQKLIYQTQTGSGREGLNFESIKSFNLNLPPLPEQQKIADYLTTIDKKIELLTEKKTELSRYKKAMMQKLFSQEIRFKPSEAEALTVAEVPEAYPEWEEKRLGEVLIEVREKSTINNQYEILSSTVNDIYLQKDYFTRDIASKDNIGYKILKINQLVFSPQNIWMGNLNVNTKFAIGLVSPSYKIFNFNNVNVKYFKYFLKTPLMIKEYLISSEQGASVVRRNLNLDLFNLIKLNVPCFNEQQKIADFLSSIDESISKVTEQIKETQNFKKAMLQQMFV